MDVRKTKNGRWPMPKSSAKIAQNAALVTEKQAYLRGFCCGMLSQ